MSFQAHQPNLNNMQQYLSKEKERKPSGDGPKWWSIPSGMSSIRILPPWDPKGMIALQVHMHPIEYQEKDMKYKKYNWTCVKETFGKPCKICEGLQELQNAGVDISKYEASRRQFYMNAIVMYDPTYQADINAGKKPEDASGVAPGTHVLMRVPKTIYDWVLSQITNPMVGDITSLTNGIDVYVTKEGTGLGTTYTPTLSPNGRTAVPQEYLSKIENLYNLDEIFSTGFDEEQIGRLVDSLKRSAGVINNNIPGVVAGMAGYPQTNIPPYNPVPQQMPMTPPTQVPTAPAHPGVTPMNNTSTAFGVGVTPPPSPFGNAGVVPPMQNVPSPQQVPAQVTPAQMPAQTTAPTVAPTNPVDDSAKPKCYGNYDPANVTCVVCPLEVSCSQSKVPF